MQPPPSTRIGYRKTKLLYLFSLGKAAKEKLICSSTMALLIISSSTPSLSLSLHLSFSFWLEEGANQSAMKEEEEKDEDKK